MNKEKYIEYYPGYVITEQMVKNDGIHSWLRHLSTKTWFDHNAEVKFLKFAHSIDPTAIPIFSSIPVESCDTEKPQRHRQSFRLDALRRVST